MSFRYGPNSRKELLLVLLLLPLSTAEGSVFFSSNTDFLRPGGHHDLSFFEEKRKNQNKKIDRKRRHSLNLSRQKFANASKKPIWSSTTKSQPMAFSAPIMIGAAAATTIGLIGKMIVSESIHRALYFWVHAGPIVAHYKFTRWYLSKTHAPLAKRDRVYNELHNRYCHKSLNIALHLKGTIFKN